MTQKANSKLPRNMSDSYVNQLHVLRAMAKDTGAKDSSVKEISTHPKPFQITEIAHNSGVKDEKETQRYLFILEGQKLVSPYPAGDFTSRTWSITKHGMKAIKMIQQTAA